MTDEQFNEFCASFQATTHVVQWGGSDVWKVGGKVFAIGGWNKNEEPAFTFKTSELDYEILKDEPGFKPAPYLASRGMKWIQQYSLPKGKAQKDRDEEIKHYLEESYNIVSKGLSKKLQKELGLNQDCTND